MQCMADLLVHRLQDEGMSFGGRVVSAINQWLPLLRQTAADRPSLSSSKAISKDSVQQQQQQQQQ